MPNDSARAPTLLAILVCDMIIRDEQTHNVSVIGIFNTIQATQFPVMHNRMHVFVSLTDGRGKCGGRLALIDRETESVLAEMLGEIVFPPDARAIVDMNFEFRQVPFQKPGSYAFDFYVEGDLIGSRPFTVVEVAAPPQPPGAKA